MDLTGPRPLVAPATPNGAPSSDSSSSGGVPGVPPALSFAPRREFKEATKDVGAVKGMSFSSDGR